MSEPDQGELESGLSDMVRVSMRPAPRTRAIAIFIIVIVVIGSGLVATHQILTSVSSETSISGGWYGEYLLSQPGTGKYIGGYSLYIVFSTGQGHQLSATTSSCTTASNGLYTQMPTPGLDFTGIISGSEFKMSSQPGDIEADLSWVGTYRADRIHIDFFPTDSPHSRTAFANLQRGTYRDYLATCNVQL